MGNKKLDWQNLSSVFEAKELREEDIPAILCLCQKNELYYTYCPPMPSRESISADLHILPAGAVPSQKHDIGYYKDNQLTAILDLITCWPDEETAFIGLFMVDVCQQKKGTGSMIILDLQKALKQTGCQKIRLGWMQGNPQAEHFWKKNGFVPCGTRTSGSGRQIIIAEKKI